MLTIRVVTPDGVTFNDTVDEVIVPTTTGEISILTNHIPLVSVLAPGELRVKKGDQEIPMVVSHGIIEIRPGNEVYVLADSAERAEHIDVSRAEVAKERAEALLKEQHISDTDFARVQAAMEKELARVRVGKKYRKLPPLT